MEASPYPVGLWELRTGLGILVQKIEFFFVSVTD